jgi:hypothetical protein
MDGEQRTEGERRAAEEFADAVRDQAARFFDAIMEEMRRNPRVYGLGSQPLSALRILPCLKEYFFQALANEITARGGDTTSDGRHLRPIFRSDLAS